LNRDTFHCGPFTAHSNVVTHRVRVLQTETISSDLLFSGLFQFRCTHDICISTAEGLFSLPCCLCIKTNIKLEKTLTHLCALSMYYKIVRKHTFSQPLQFQCFLWKKLNWIWQWF